MSRDDWRGETDSQAGERPLNQAPLPLSPSPLARRLIPFASGAPAFGALKAILQANCWPTDENGTPRMVVKVEGEKQRALMAYHIVLPYHPLREEVMLAQKELAYEILRAMGPDTAWLHMLLLAYCAQAEKGKECIIPRAVIYQALGLDQRDDLTRQQKDERCRQALWPLQSLGLSLVHWSLKGTAMDYERRTSYLWNITIREYGQARLEMEGGKWGKRRHDWQIVVAPGGWANLCLFGEPMRAVGYMAREMFEKLDRRSAPWGAPLAMMLTFHARFARNGAMRVTNREVIEFAGGESYPDDRKRRYEVRQRVIDAIEEQRKWGWLPDYSAWPDYLRPHLDVAGSRDSGRTARRLPRGYWDAFLQARTSFVLPVELQRLNRQAAGIRLSQPEPKPTTLATTSPSRVDAFVATDIRKLRMHAGMTQAQLAKCLGVSRSMLAMMELGRRAVAGSTRARLSSLGSALQ